MGALDRKARRRPQSWHGYLALLFVVVITILTTWEETSRQHEEGATMPLVANNAVSRLAASIGAADTQISLQAGTGSMFPAPSGDWFPITLIKPSGEFEIVHCTARNSDVLTVQRAMEGTGAKAFAAGDRVELRLTAATLNAMIDAARLTFTPVQQGGGADGGAGGTYGLTKGGDGGDGGQAVSDFAPGALSPGAVLTVTVPSGGAGGAGQEAGAKGGNGAVYISWT